MTTIVVIAILSVMALNGFLFLRARAQRASCSSNLRNLHAATHAYLQDQAVWPQIHTTTTESPTYALAWIKALAPYNVSRINWICPTVQQLLGDPEYEKNANARVDYFATPFDNQPSSPTRWPKQPWFSERGNVHGNGNLIVFPDGHVESLGEVLKSMRQQ